MSDENKIRIQKHLSQAGICSRRKAEDFIQAGQVLVNGEVVTELGTRVDPELDIVELAPSAKKELKNCQYIAYYKPKGIVTHSPQKGEKCIQDIIAKPYRHLAPIGRLDKDSEGLILLTDDGVFAKNCLSHENPHERVYLIRVSKALTEDDMDEIRDGIPLFGKATKPCEIEESGPHQYLITLYEGKNRQVRRIIQKVGSMVTQLKRLSFGPVDLGGMQPNEAVKIDPKAWSSAS